MQFLIKIASLLFVDIATVLVRQEERWLILLGRKVAKRHNGYGKNWTEIGKMSRSCIADSSPMRCYAVSNGSDRLFKESFCLVLQLSSRSRRTPEVCRTKHIKKHEMYKRSLVNVRGKNYLGSTDEQNVTDVRYEITN